MKKTAETSTPILSVLAERWSPRAFTDKALSLDAITPALEAGRWAASASNVQPWRIYAASKSENPEGFAKLLSLLVPFNAAWAKGASILIIGAAQVENSEGNPQASALYDLGLFMGNFATQITADGLYLHQMTGFDAPASAKVLDMPVGWQAVFAGAIGEIGTPDSLPEKLAAREVEPRTRKPLDEILFKA
ncbi:nitroreductase [Ketogulonicigenium robustum]|uniref:Nitroreductase n=1 Tax=Ketogulonicigenium robustum TaxID=92947 RepID=A0A1W6NWL9_9RHOB|nr:nitroreductase family protein [Ketogulonicigenium robustum]ARO13500.1 nitroreductase [Ketogulonicigenium robustum]